MDAIKNILNRRSSKKLVPPYPSEDEMRIVYKAALRAPDHAWLRPSSFIEVTGKGLDKLSDIFSSYAIDNIKDLNELKIKKYKNAPYRAPMIIILISSIKAHPKVPKIEQMLSTSAAAQNILLALNALGYGAIWRTGLFALNKMIGQYYDLSENQEILGYLYIGTTEQNLDAAPDVDIDKFVTKWK